MDEEEEHIVGGGDGEKVPAAAHSPARPRLIGHKVEIASRPGARGRWAACGLRNRSPACLAVPHRRLA